MSARGVETAEMREVCGWFELQVNEVAYNAISREAPLDCIAMKIAKSTKADEVALGVLCAVACLAAAGLYLFNFSSEPLSKRSLFWAMPIICPIAFIAYLRSKRIGTVAQLAFYVLSVIGAYQMFLANCRRRVNCYTHNTVAIAAASMFAGIHIVAMFGATALMCIATAKTLRHA